MKLDLLYEIDVPKPWGAKPHPSGQREHEQQAYRDAIEQIKLADKLGFHTSWHVEHHFREERSHCPAPEVMIGALSHFNPQQFSDADMIIVGDPEQCLEKMVKYHELGVDQLICYVQFGHLSHESIMKTIELLGTKVIPKLKSLEIKTSATVSSGGLDLMSRS